MKSYNPSVFSLFFQRCRRTNTRITFTQHEHNTQCTYSNVHFPHIVIKQGKMPNIQPANIVSALTEIHLIDGLLLMFISFEVGRWFDLHANNYERHHSRLHNTISQNLLDNTFIITIITVIAIIKIILIIDVLPINENSILFSLFKPMQTRES